MSLIRTSLRLLLAPGTVRPRWIRDRQLWSKSIRRTIDLASPGNPSPAVHYVSKDVVLSCVPSLHAIATTLDDPGVPVTEEAIRALRDFLTDGASSPLYGQDPERAREAAEQLGWRFGVIR